MCICCTLVSVNVKSTRCINVVVHVVHVENIQNHGQLQTLNQVRGAQLAHQRNCWMENPLVAVKINYEGC